MNLNKNRNEFELGWVTVWYGRTYAMDLPLGGAKRKAMAFSIFKRSQ